MWPLIVSVSPRDHALMERDRSHDRLVRGRHEQLCSVQPVVQVAQVGDVERVQLRVDVRSVLLVRGDEHRADRVMVSGDPGADRDAPIARWCCGGHRAAPVTMAVRTDGSRRWI